MIFPLLGKNQLSFSVVVLWAIDFAFAVDFFSSFLPQNSPLTFNSGAERWHEPAEGQRPSMRAM